LAAFLRICSADRERGAELGFARFLAGNSFRDGRTYLLVAARANGQLAFGACWQS